MESARKARPQREHFKNFFMLHVSCRLVMTRGVSSRLNRPVVQAVKKAGILFKNPGLA